MNIDTPISKTTLIADFIGGAWAQIAGLESLKSTLAEEKLLNKDIEEALTNLADNYMILIGCYEGLGKDLGVIKDKPELSEKDDDAATDDSGAINAEDTVKAEEENFADKVVSTSEDDVQETESAGEIPEEGTFDDDKLSDDEFEVVKNRELPPAIHEPFEFFVDFDEPVDAKLTDDDVENMRKSL